VTVTHTFVFSLFCQLLFHYIPMDKETHVFITNSNIIKNLHYHHQTDPPFPIPSTTGCSETEKG